MTEARAVRDGPDIVAVKATCPHKRSSMAVITSRCVSFFYFLYSSSFGSAVLFRLLEVFVFVRVFFVIASTPPTITQELKSGPQHAAPQPTLASDLSEKNICNTGMYVFIELGKA